jgi:hypothetical protein
MGLTLLSGEPVMCILIIAGKKPNALVEMGINNEATMVGKEGDEDFFKTTAAKTNYFLADPSVKSVEKQSPASFAGTKKGV